MDDVQPLLSLSQVVNKKQNAEAFKDTKLMIGKNVRLRREAMSLSQEQLGLRIEADQAYISRLERGILNPTVESLVEIAFALEIDVNRLLSDPTRL